MTQGNRLERAVSLHLLHEQQGGDWEALLREHADLADLLRGLRDDSEAGLGAPSLADSGVPLQLGDYRLERELGRGGNGGVYLAHDQRLGRRVAIKLLHDDLAERPTTVARLLREGQLLARLDHPGIVKVLDVGSHQGRPWIAMEFLAGASLAERLADLRKAGGHTGDSMRQLVGVVAQVGAALAHAHAAGIVHRDVKPSNILLRDGTTAVLSDFGIARDGLAPALTQTGIVVGSPHYMAPELAGGDGNRGDARADVFALGATLYECITLRRAFEGPDARAVLHAVLHKDPPDPRRLQRGVPIDLLAIVQKALEKDPAHRYPTALDFAADLQAFLDLREVTARATTGLSRWLRRARRNPMVGTAAALAVVLCGVLVWLALQWPRFAAVREAERELEYSAATAAGFAQREGQLAQLARAIAIAPDRPEAIVGLVMRLGDEQGPVAALVELERHLATCTDAVLHRCRAWLLRRQQRTAEAQALEATLPPPRTSLDLWVHALQLTAAPPTPPAARAEALASISLAVRNAPRASLPLHVGWARLAVMAGDKEKRIEAAESLLGQWPDEAVALYIAGEALMPYEAKRSIDLLERALALGIRDPRCAVSLGFACAVAGEKERAVAVLRDAFARDDLLPEPRASVLAMLERLDATEIADELATAWAIAAPEVPEARRFAGRAARRRGDLDGSLAHLEHAARLRPAEIELRLDLAAVLEARGDFPRQRTELQALVAAHPKDRKVHRALVDAAVAHGPREVLLGELRRWTGLMPDDQAAWRDLAQQLLAMDDAATLDEAVRAAERADYLADGKDAAILELRATALERCGARYEAERVRRRAAALPR